MLAARMDDAELEREWERVLGAWDEPDAHKRFLVLADTSGRLALAGKRYRDAKDADPARGPIADQQIDRILGLAMAQMKAIEKTEPGKGRSKVEWIAFGVSAALIAAALYQLLRAM
jgi:hypothetical protein